MNALQVFAEKLLDWGFAIVNCNYEDQGGKIEFENHDGSNFELWIGENGEIESGSCSSISSGDNLDIFGLHLERGDTINEFPYEELSNW